MLRQAMPITAPVPSATETESLWYKDAVIYQVHVRSFFDGNGDGVGDFIGIAQKLDYIQDLGVTAIWLLPFFPSPLRDDGYDIADYGNVNPTYGTLKDFKNFLAEAHRRDLRVITELVMNHTSDQHEWFQRSRRAKPGTKWRDFYVWSDTADKYQEARIIFQDFEKSNWTWDSVAGAYFWHRFYHHQPDLNFDNPEVREAMFKALDFWLDMGVDGVRLDAIPYLFEREGTNCENLPETHAFLKQLRAHIDEKYSGRMLLAEANQWPEDAAAYFGDGDECHMNFHFPLMPRLFMAVEREDRFPIIDILDQTPLPPEKSQWGIFLRNHDELTLEMVTNEERDYMYRAFAADPQARINLGIRRRLMPLLQNDRRKTELMIGLLLSLPGSPILYYGDEIGMGDNIYLGDRNGVRTPMQWNSNSNAGFSHANPQRLFLPVIIDPEYHYSIRNVEVSQSSPHSLLWWMRRIINQRKQCPAFGRGTFEMLLPDNPKVLAYLRQTEDETLLVVANLSRYAQCASLDLSRFRGQRLIELFGHTRFPPIGELPFFLTLGGHGFYWFRLQWTKADAPDASAAQIPTYKVKQDWENIFRGRGKGVFERAVSIYVRRHRWFAGKARDISRTELLDWFGVQQKDSPAGDIHIVIVRITYTDGDPEMYIIPIVFAGPDQARNIIGDHPPAGILQLERAEDNATVTLCEAIWEKELWLPLLDCIRQGGSIEGQVGSLRGTQTQLFQQLANDVSDSQPPKVHGGEQSNTSAIFSDKFILKLFRRLNQGLNPDLEIGRFFTEKAPFEHVPHVAGALEYVDHASEATTVAILHEYKPNEGDAWVYTLDELGRYLERIQSVTPEDESEVPKTESKSLLELADMSPPKVALEKIGPYLDMVALLGRRTAEMHLILASATDDPAFVPEGFSKLYLRGVYQSMRTSARKTLDLLRRQFSQLPAVIQPLARTVLDKQPEVLARFGELLKTTIHAKRIRCHGDYHLGQVLFTGKDFLIIDLEGEPDRPVSERRIKRTALRDVAGMIRSFHYASHSALLRQAPGLVPQREGAVTPEHWVQFWYSWVAAAFLKAYFVEASAGKFLPTDRAELETMLRTLLLEKAMYELSYELNNRPDWVKIPLEGILRLLG